MIFIHWQGIFNHPIKQSNIDQQRIRDIHLSIDFLVCWIHWADNVDMHSYWVLIGFLISIPGSQGRDGRSLGLLVAESIPDHNCGFSMSHPPLCLRACRLSSSTQFKVDVHPLQKRLHRVQESCSWGLPPLRQIPGEFKELLLDYRIISSL